MKRTAAILAMVCMTLGVSPALAKKQTTYSFVGIVTAVDVDDDPATVDTITFDVSRANNAGTRYADAHDGHARVVITAATSVGDDFGTVEDGSDVRVADGVFVRAVKSGSHLSARSVSVRYQEYTGTLEDYDDELGTVSVSYSETNEFADSWLEANDNPEMADADLTDDAEVWSADGTDPSAGDNATMYARPNEDGDGLEAVYVETWQPEQEGLLPFPIL